MTDEIVQVLRGRSFRDTLFGKVRYGQAIMQTARGERREVAVVIKEYDRDLVERRMTKNGEQVGEDAKEELRIHSLLCTASAASASASASPTAPPTFPSTGHPHVVHLFDVRKDERFYYAILEYCSRGEFFPLVQHADFTALYARHYFRQLMAGLAYMHSHHIAHRDLSLENILLDDKGNLKICDLLANKHTRWPRYVRPQQNRLTCLATSPYLSLVPSCQRRGGAVQRRQRSDARRGRARGQGEVLHAA